MDYLNKKQDSNKEIDKFFKLKISKQTINKLSDLTLEFVNSKTLLDLQNCIIKHENIISKTLKIDTIKNMYFKDYEGQIKSLGAWGGDFVLVVSKENPSSYFIDKGYETVIAYDDMIL
mgnify:CR=1 FL=1